jgi:shikimate dehydrogenase
MHNAAFKALGMPYVYVPFPVTPDCLEQALRALPALGIVGVNLTIPHKEAALNIVDAVTDRAREVGAVNTIHCVEGTLVGDNTDGYGFSQPLIEAGYTLDNMRVLVLGAGGAARSAVFELARRGAKTAIQNRGVARARALAEAVESCGYARPVIIESAESPQLAEWTASSGLIVNTTSVGMYPEIDGVPDLQFDLMQPSQLIYDMVYNPRQTRLLAEAARRGCAVMNGVKMLVYQGAAAFERWTGVLPPTDIMERAVIDGLI